MEFRQRGPPRAGPRDDRGDTDEGLPPPVAHSRFFPPVSPSPPADDESSDATLAPSRSVIIPSHRTRYDRTAAVSKSAYHAAPKDDPNADPMTTCGIVWYPRYTREYAHPVATTSDDATTTVEWRWRYRSATAVDDDDEDDVDDDDDDDDDDDGGVDGSHDERRIERDGSDLADHDAPPLVTCR